MSWLSSPLLIGIVAFPSLLANPAIYPHGVVNAGSFYPVGLPAGSIAQGSIFSIFGTGLGPGQGVQQQSFPLTTNLANVSITATQGGTTVNVIPLYVAQGQVNALMPSNTPLGWVSLRLTYNNVPSNPSPVYVVHDSPGIFTATGTGIGPAAVNNFVSAANRPANSNQVSAQPGQIETLYLTGLGPISSPDNLAPPNGNVATAVEVWVGGVPAAVNYSGRSPCCSGLDQIDFVVPPNAPQGCWVPVYVQTSHINVSNFASMAISAKGGSCSDPTNLLAGVIGGGGTLGSISLYRMSVHEDVGVNAPVDVSNDLVAYSATKLSTGLFTFLPFSSTPPPGTCTVYPGTGDFLQTGSVPQVVPSALDGGTQLSVTGPGGQQTVTTTHNGAYLGSYLPLYSFPNQLFLTPGPYIVKSNGGADIPGFTASITMPAPLTWTNRDQIGTVSRSQPLTLSWSGSVADQPVGILGVGSDLPADSSAVFLCVAPAGASSFTVPAQVVHSLPYSRANPLASKDVIYLISATASSFSASGLSSVAAAGGYVLGKTVIFQ